jgi:lipopolysaccharide export system protein LptA
LGDARLWQTANVVQAPVIVFDRDRRSLQAEGTARQQVSTALVQEDSKGKITPVSITAARLTYHDRQRRARFEGGVLVRSADGVMTADHIDVFLKASQTAAGASRSTAATVSGAPSQLEKIVAEGHVVVQQPTRRANGNTLVYTSEAGKFVLTGGPPTIMDSERGTITGASLTFYSRDDRVLVEGGDHGRTVTNTRVSK